MKCWYIFDCCLLSDHNHNFYMNRPHIHLTLSIDLFTDTAAILNSIVSNGYYGMLREQMHTNLPPEINKNRNGHLIGKKSK